VRQPGAAASAVEDLVQPGGRQPVPAAFTLEHHEHRVGVHAGRPLNVQVDGDRGEEPRRNRDQPLVAALAVGDARAGMQISPDVSVRGALSSLGWLAAG
jgi:hypothetical protein